MSLKSLFRINLLFFVFSSSSQLIILTLLLPRLLLPPSSLQTPSPQPSSYPFLLIVRPSPLSPLRLQALISWRAATQSHLYSGSTGPLKVSFYSLPSERVWAPGTRTVAGICCWRNAPPWRRAPGWANGSRASPNAPWVSRHRSLICVHLARVAIACISPNSALKLKSC